MLRGTAFLYTDPTLTQSANNSRCVELLATKPHVHVNALNANTKVQENVLTDNTTTADFINMQQNDVTLAECFKQAKEPNSAYFLDNGILFRKAVVCGIEVQQVVLPVQKREHVLNIAHSSDWGGHLGRKKT